MRMPALILALGLCITAGGCSSTSGTAAVLDQRKVAQIQEGASTKADLTRLFGTAQQVSRNADGSEVWTYEYTDLVFGCLGPMGIFLGGHACDYSKTSFTLSIEISQAGLVVNHWQSSKYKGS